MIDSVLTLAVASKMFNKFKGLLYEMFRAYYFVHKTRVDVGVSIEFATFVIFGLGLESRL